MVKVMLDPQMSPGVLYTKGYRIKSARGATPEQMADYNYEGWTKVNYDVVSALESAGYVFVMAQPPM